MTNEPTGKVSRFLKLDYEDPSKIWLSEQKTLRTLVGILGMLLPVLLCVFLLIDSGYFGTLESISHYYFTRASSVFIIVVSLLAIFLLIYKGKEKIDFYLSSLAGIFALILILFPTGNISDLCHDSDKLYSVTILKKSDFRVGVHYISAAIFLLSLAYMSLFLFTKSDKAAADRGVWKRRRNRVFRTCGVVMVLAVLVVFPGSKIFTVFYEQHHLTFWMETVAIESFGISWLVKGELVMGD